MYQKKSHVYVEDFTELTDWLEPLEFRDQLFWAVFSP